jgi:hypothetical protein
VTWETGNASCDFEQELYLRANRPRFRTYSYDFPTFIWSVVLLLSYTKFLHLSTSELCSIPFAYLSVPVLSPFF